MTATRDSVSTETELIKFDDLAKSLGVEVEKGLSAGEASRRLTAGRNELPSPAGTSWIQRIWSHVREPMSLLLLSAALVSFVALRHPRDAVAISAIVVINVLIAVVQEEKAATALAALRSAAAPFARALRSDQPVMIPAAEVVPGDVVLLAAGEGVPADIWLFDGWSLEANESMLTGESLAVAKSAAPQGDMALPLGDRTWLAYAGTLITAG